MEKEVIEKNFEEFINIINTNIKRDGIDNVVSWLKLKSDAKIAPASTKYHLSVPGGLIQHSLNVYYRLKKILEAAYPAVTKTTEEGVEYVENTCPYTEETIAIVALFHDLSKVNFYDVQERNVKDESGNWIKVPYYAVKDDTKRLIFDTHPINSYYMLSKFIKLNYEEELAIIHHEGAFESDISNMAKSNVMSAWRRSPLGMYLHFADMSATILDEEVTD